MLYLLLGIVSSTSLFVIFKIIDKKNIKILPVIVTNYLAASFLGFISFQASGATPVKDFAEWAHLAGIIGILFIVVFLIMSESTKKSGIVVTTISAKLSVVIPIFFSLLIDKNDVFTPLKSIGFFLTVTSIFLLTYKKNEYNGIKRSFTIIPLYLFIGAGTVDLLIKYAQYSYIGSGSLIAFTTILFISSFISGIFLSILKRAKIKTYMHKPVLLSGTILGIFNFGSFYFFVKALNSGIFKKTVIDSSIVFGINNIGVVSLSAFIGIFVFNENFSIYKKIGIIISMITIIVLMLSQNYYK